jgi:hypothetical protein
MIFILSAAGMKSDLNSDMNWLISPVQSALSLAAGDRGPRCGSASCLRTGTAPFAMAPAS